jgi:hypothetical protein
MAPIRIPSRAGYAMLGSGDVKFLRDKRQGDASHKNDEAFEKFACSSECPDAPLHCRQGR